MSDALPAFYHPDQVGDWDYEPDPVELRAAAAAAPLPPAERDERRTTLLLVDHQRDFVHPEGALFVSGRSGDGAQQDSRRVAEFMHRKGDRITSVVATLDTHHLEQVFFARFWIDEDGRHPDPFTMITRHDLRRGRWRPDPSTARLAPEGAGPGWAERQVEHYAETLEREGRHGLIVWPDHCIEGTRGHGLLGAVAAAIRFHAIRREIKPTMLRKGSDVWTESYSVFRPEVPVAWDGRPVAHGHEARMLRLLAEADEILVAGEASSHCVLWSVNDLVRAAHAAGPGATEKITILEDCMSAVVSLDPGGEPIPALDFTPAAEAGFAAWRREGVRFSTAAAW